jgi:hypothetical protein
VIEKKDEGGRLRAHMLQNSSQNARKRRPVRRFGADGKVFIKMDLIKCEDVN